MRESDLYPPLKALLQSQGYEVKGEVHNCDVTAIRGEESPVVVELKLNLNISLLMQAADRLALTPKVYVGVPVECSLLNKQHKRVVKLLRMLGLGLIAIDASAGKTSDIGATAVLLDPAPYQPRRSHIRSERLLGEFHRRIGDPNAGGADRRRGLMTAYRQRALRIASYLEQSGTCKASLIASTLDEPKARDILYRDVYGWFDGHGAGQYSLSPRGNKEIALWLPAQAKPKPAAKRKARSSKVTGKAKGQSTNASSTKSARKSDDRQHP